MSAAGCRSGTAFQSTQPKRAATDFLLSLKPTGAISIHAAQEGCDEVAALAVRGRGISIHAAQEGCDSPKGCKTLKHSDFNPRSPRGLRLLPGFSQVIMGDISIHAAQEGCDANVHVTRQDRENISIHAAQEGCDHKLFVVGAVLSRFQSTQPKRAATMNRFTERLINC